MLLALTTYVCVFLSSSAGGQDTLSRLVERWPHAVTADEELALLERMSAVVEASEADIVEALALGLTGVEDRVRARAVELLLAGDRAVLALDIVEAETRELAREERRLREQVGAIDRGTLEQIGYMQAVAQERCDLFESKRAASEARDHVDQEDREALVSVWDEALADHQRHLTWLEQQRARAEGLELVKGAMAFGLANARDPRSVRAVSNLLGASGLGASTRRIAAALLELGDAAALDAVGWLLDDYEEMRDLQVERLGQLEREDPLPKPIRAWDDADWERSERGRIGDKIAAARAELERLDASAAGIAVMLREFAASASLEPPPDDLLPARAWWSWARSAGAALPALGG